MNCCCCVCRFQPTVEDCEMYSNYTGNKSKLGEVDQFMMELCKIPELENRLDLTQLLWEFPHQLHCLEPVSTAVICHISEWRFKDNMCSP